MSYDFNKYKDDKVSLPRNAAWGNWAKFEKVGDKVQGYVRDVFYRKAEGIYKEGRCFTLEQAGGELVNVATKRIPFIMAETDGFRMGDPITLELVELRPNEKGNPTKIISVFGKKIATEGPTVKDLEAEDMKANGGQPEGTDAELEKMAADASAIQGQVPA